MGWSRSCASLVLNNAQRIMRFKYLLHTAAQAAWKRHVSWPVMMLAGAPMPRDRVSQRSPLEAVCGFTSAWLRALIIFGKAKARSLWGISATAIFLLFANYMHAQCQYDVCGYWYSESYNSGVQVEYFSIDMVGDQMVCMKILGDAFVPTGHATWQGLPSSCAFGGVVYGASGPGTAIVSLPCTVSIISQDYIKVTSAYTVPLDFHRSNTEHLDFVGVDYSNFPVSCIACDNYFPNVFTPNDDGVNDLLQPACSSASHLCSIRDRRGCMVFQSNEPRPVWDGREGRTWANCPPGVYFWSILLEEHRTGKVLHGTVQLLR